MLAVEKSIVVAECFVSGKGHPKLGLPVVMGLNKLKLHLSLISG